MNAKINIDEKDDYIGWLENIFLSFLTNDKIVSREDILKKIKQRGIDIDNHFVTHLLEIQSKKQKEKIIIQALPLLESYPIGFDDDVYDKDIELLYKWELKTVKTLLLKLEKQYKRQYITPEEYHDFFFREIEPYRKYFINDMDLDGLIYEKILPDNILLYWGYRLNEEISWDKSWEQKNIGISITSIIEGDYLSQDKRMENFRHLIG